MFQLLNKNIQHIGPEAFKKEMTGDYLLVDVRTEEEYESGHIESAVNIPLDTIPAMAGELREHDGKRILLYCLSGARSVSAAMYLDKLGIGKLYNLSGGIAAWSRIYG